MEQSTRDWLKDYFTYDWPSSRTAGLDGYYWTGWRLIDEVKEGQRVLDVGCGVNPFKRHLPNLTGIDITDIGSDIQTSIEDYSTEDKYDIAFALGSLNFGTWDDIIEQTTAMTNCMKDKASIYWRCNPGHRDHGNERVKDIPFFNWNINHHILLCTLLNWKVTEFMPDKNRMYVRWERDI